MAYVCSFQLDIFKPEEKIIQTGFQTLVMSMASPNLFSFPFLLTHLFYL